MHCYLFFADFQWWPFDVEFVRKNVWSSSILNGWILMNFLSKKYTYDY